MAYSGAITHLEYGRGEPLVFLHGIGGNADVWQPQLAFFSRYYRAIAWDMPGYGGSAPLAEMTFPALAEALLVLLDRLSLDKVHLLGHSMGGMVAQTFASQHAGRLHSLVLAATSAAFGRSDGAWQQQFLRERLEPLERGVTMAELAPQLVAGITGDDADKAGIELAVRSMARVEPDTYRSALRCLLDFDQRSALPGIAVPTLILAGANDRTAPAPVMEKMARRMPQASYVCLEGLGHLANLENPARFNCALMHFLQQVG